MRRQIALFLFTLPAAAQTQSASKQLPITHVSLYKNGVGFFEHTGRVTGTQSITIDFTSAQLNDVLQSLTAVDLAGGRITGAGFNSTTPLDQQLSTLALGLPADTDSDTLFVALRGTRLEVLGQGAPFTGRLVDIETRTLPSPDSKPATTNRILTVASESGQIRIFTLTPSLTIRLLDTGTATNLTQYLQTIDRNRTAGLRHLTVTDTGAGTRDLHISYLSEVPVWKSTYRILFDGASPTATLQGYSVIDNTTGTDWVNVHLSLIAGAPQSFIQPISTPYYTRRPEIPLPAEAQLAPQTHDSGESNGSGLHGTVSDTSGAIIPNASIRATNTQTGATFSDSSNGDGTFTVASVPPGTYTVEITSPGFQLKRQTVNVGSDGSAALNVMLPVGSSSASVEVSSNAVNSLPIEGRHTAERKLQQGFAPSPSLHGGLASGYGNGIGYGGNISGGVARIYSDLATQTFNNQATTQSFDDYFAYNLTDPITLLKDQSALVPILQAKLPIERVTLWTALAPATPPLRALWITNSSSLTLDRGSFAIVEDANFAGEGLLDPIHPAERRLLSYAVDEAVRVSSSSQLNSSHVTKITISGGVLHQTSTEVREITYDIHNAAPDPRTLLIEHPVLPGFTLDSTPKPTETTPTVYRFEVKAASGETVHLHVGARHVNQESYRLVDVQENQLLFILRNAHVTPAGMAQLQPAFDLHHQVLAKDAEIKAAEDEIAAITKDQDRLRENLKTLKGTPEEKALATRYTGELNTQEDRLAQLRTQLTQLHQQRQTLDDQFHQAIQQITLDESL